MLLKRKVKGKAPHPLLNDSGISSQGSTQSSSQTSTFRNPHPGFRIPRSGLTATPRQSPRSAVTKPAQRTPAKSTSRPNVRQTPTKSFTTLSNVSKSTTDCESILLPEKSSVQQTGRAVKTLPSPKKTFSEIIEKDMNRTKSKVPQSRGKTVKNFNPPPGKASTSKKAKNARGRSQKKRQTRLESESESECESESTRSRSRSSRSSSCSSSSSSRSSASRRSRTASRRPASLASTKAVSLPDSVKKGEERKPFVFRFYSTWVECVRCMKWRVLLDVYDPSSLSDDWNCSMQTDPEAKAAGCSAPAMRCSSQIEQCFILIDFSEGSIVWARMPGYPSWPAMVDRDPNNDTYIDAGDDYAYSDDDDIPQVRFYHVTFLDADVSRAWVSRNHLKPYKSKNDMKQMQIAPRYRKTVEKACEAADCALKLNLKDRIKRFGFAFRWKGKSSRWLTTSDITKEDLQKQKRRKPRQGTKKQRKSPKNPTISEIMETTKGLVRTADELMEDIQRDFIALSQQSSQQSTQ